MFGLHEMGTSHESMHSCTLIDRITQALGFSSSFQEKHFTELTNHRTLFSSVAIMLVYSSKGK